MPLDRSQGIGCSDIPSIMGVSPWKSAFQLWEEKVSGRSDTKDTPYMKYGRDTEPLIRKKTEEKLGFSLEPIRIIHPSKSWLWASLDGYNADKGIISEFKTANKNDHVMTISGRVPEKYWPQVQGQMEVVGVESLFYCSYYEGDLEILEVGKDAAYCEEMMHKIDKFWECVVLETLPEGYVCMKGNQAWNHLTEEIKSIRGQIKALAEADEALTQRLKELSQGRNAKGDTSFFQKQECLGSVNYKEAIDVYLKGMRAHHPQVHFPEIDLESYRKKSFEKWSLRFINK